MTAKRSHHKKTAPQHVDLVVDTEAYDASALNALRDERVNVRHDADLSAVQRDKQYGTGITHDMI